MHRSINPSSGNQLVCAYRGSTVVVVVIVMALLAAAAGASSARAAAPSLGTAASAAVLAGSTVTNTGASVISGDLGLHPGTAVSGFPPGLVLDGTTHVADGVAVQAKADLTTAYNDAASRSSGATISSDLAGSSLSPGVYSSATSLGLSGDLTLDAQGNPDAVFIFQAGSTLTAAVGSRVLLTNGARACNVFWQVGSSATIQTGSSFAGTIMALTSITLDTDTTLKGRALARNGAVTLDTNLVTKPACAQPPTASDTSATTGPGEPVTVVLHGSDPSGGPLTFVIDSGPVHGTLGPVDQGAGTVTYTPAAGYAGPDPFTYHVTSAAGSSGTATGAVTVTPAAGTAITPGTSPGAGGTATLPGAGGTPTLPGAGPAAGAARPGAGPGTGSTGLGTSTGVANTPEAGMSVRLSGPSACVKNRFRARVIGREIAQVMFFFAGKWRRTVTAKPGQSVFSVIVHPRGKSSAVRRVTAKVRFMSTTGAKPVKLHLVYQRCSRAAVRPAFTG